MGGLRLPCVGLRLSTLLDRVWHGARRSSSWERRDGGLWKVKDKRGQGSVGPSDDLLERFRFRLHHRVQNLGAALARRKGNKRVSLGLKEVGWKKKKTRTHLSKHPHGLDRGR